MDSKRSKDSSAIRLKVTFGIFLAIHPHIFADKSEMEVSGDLCVFFTKSAAFHLKTPHLYSVNLGLCVTPVFYSGCQL